jgi:RNA polymerase sigma factor FliA
VTATALGTQQLIEQCQGMVRSLAVAIHRKLPPRFELDDLIAYGQVGLAEAAKEFDPERGAQFSTVAYYRIRGAIYDGVSKMTWFGRAGQQQARFEQKANETLMAEAESGPKSASANLEDDARWFRDISRTLAVVYLASHGSSGGENREFDVADPAPPPPHLAIEQEIVKQLHSQINALPAEESKFIRAMYFEGQTMQQAGERLGISKSWASRLHHKVLQRLAKTLASAGMDM